MKHKVRIFEIDRAVKSDSPPQEREPLDVDAETIASAREQAHRALADAGWQVRAISHAVDGGLIAYVIKLEQKPRQRRQRPRRESEFVRK